VDIYRAVRHLQTIQNPLKKKDFQTITVLKNSTQIDGNVSVSNFYFYFYEPTSVSADFRAQCGRYLVVTHCVVFVDPYFILCAQIH
jgi:hypothetical protein